MVYNISKHNNDTSKFSGSLAKLVFSGFLALNFTGSGLIVYTNEIETGNVASNSSPIYKSDISEQF